MKLIIFAGGVGTRLWPLSRRNSPKQFSAMKDGKSTLQLAVERVKFLGMDNIYISTNAAYASIVSAQAPAIPAENIFVEPVRRDLAAAVGLSAFRLYKQGYRGPLALIWSDHFMDRPQQFAEALRTADELVCNDADTTVFFGEKPRFANHNLGWIHKGKKVDKNIFKFFGLKYKPEQKVCEEMFASGDWLWNTGYFVFDIGKLVSFYKEFEPEMHASLAKMADDETLIESEYPKLEAKSFDKAIAEHISSENSVVLDLDLGWSDPGTLYALKEALVGRGDENVSRGDVILEKSSDTLIFNEVQNKIVVGVGLSNLVIVNTEDAILVCHKDAVPEMTALVKKLETEGKSEFV